MASAWGSSWGSSWGNSWGAVGAVVVARDRSDAGFVRGPKRVFILPRPEPIAAPLAATKPKRRRVTEEAVFEAIALPWAGRWTVPEAMAVLPELVPVEFKTPDPESLDTLIQAVGLYLEAEAAKREFEQDEEDVLLLLAAA
jgi:hypothetical protein